jgi:phosphonate degradation associated HDIG domain protein
MSLTLADIESLFARKGSEQYTGEPVSHLEHALQSAWLAEQEGAGDALITAALLHDLGHLLHDMDGTPSAEGVDDLHQYRAIPFLRGLFDDEVLGAIAGHVDAKRYLCAVRPGYHAGLSDDSKRSLTLQGGVYDTAQAQTFIRKPGAVRLRIWDDLAKSPGLVTPDLQHFMAVAARVSKSAGAAS